MNTFVSFAGNLAEEPQLLHTRDGKPFVTCRVLVNRRCQTTAGEWVDEEPTGHTVKIYGSAANHVHDSAGKGDRLTVQGQLRTEAWNDESGQKRTKQVVIVDGWSGEVGLSLKHGAARTERGSAASAVRG